MMITEKELWPETQVTTDDFNIKVEDVIRQIDLLIEPRTVIDIDGFTMEEE